MKTLLLCLINLSCLTNAFSNIDSTAIKLGERALIFLKNEQIDSFISSERDALLLFKKDENLYEWMRYYRSKGNFFASQKKYKACFEAYKIATEEGIREPENPKEHRARALIFAAIGYYHKQLNDHKTSVKNYEIAKHIFENSVDDKITLGEFIYSELGNAYTRLRAYEKAEFYHLKRKGIFEKEKEWNLLAEACIDLGLVYLYKKKYSKSIATFNEGLERMPSEIDTITKLDLLVSLADAHFRNEDFEKMLSFSQEYEKLVRQSKLKQREKQECLFSIKINYGKYYRELKDYKKAEHYFSDAQKILDQSSFKTNRNYAFVQMYLGDIYYRQYQYNHSLESFHSAMLSFLPTYDDSNVGSLPEVNQIIIEPNLIAVFRGKSKCFMELYRRGDGEFYSEKALESLELANHLDKLLLQEYALEGSTLTALWKNRGVKKDILETNFELWSKNKTPELEEAMFAISEQSRAVMMLEGKNISNAIGSDNVEEWRFEYDDSVNEVETLRRKIYELSRRTATASEDFLDSLNNKLVTALSKRKNIENQIADAISEGKQTYVSISNVQEYLKEDQVLVEYFAHQEVIFIFIITNKIVDIKRAEWNSDWVKKTETIKEHILKYDPEFQNTPNVQQAKILYIQQATALYDYLVKPIVDTTDAKKLIIIPDGELWNIPFDALLTKSITNEEKDNFRKYPYLINEKIISHPFSATLLLQKKKREKLKFVAFAPNYFDIIAETLISLRNSLDTLTHNVPEATDISNLIRGEMFSKENANKENFIRALGSKGVIHFAGHAKANLSNPDLSYLAFTNTGDTSNYKLFGYELDNLSILTPASIVVLSGCETGTGPIAKGEGVLSLARTFASLGTESIIMTQWSIVDKSAKNIMVKFYKKVREGLSLDQSLHEAKKEYIINEKIPKDYAHPKYWAAFSPLGNMEPIEFETSSSTSFLFYLLGGVALIIIFAFFRRRKKRDS